MSPGVPEEHTTPTDDRVDTGLPEGARGDDADMIVDILKAACAAVEAADEDGLLRMFHERPETFVFDYTPPRTPTTGRLRETFRAATRDVVGSMTCEVREVETYLLSPDAAWTAAIMHMAARYGNGDGVDLTYRATDIWRRIDGRWGVVHEHASVPVDPTTGRADLQSSP